MRINSNMTAKTTNRMLTERYENMGRKMEKLSSGRKINRAGDDSAGLAISEKMKAQIRGYNKAMQNIQDAVNLVDIADGALNETHNILQRIRELSVQSANDTYVNKDRDKLQLEVNELLSEIDKIAGETHYNTKNLIDGFYKEGFNFFVGPNKDNIYGLILENMNNVSLKVEGLNLSSQKLANESIKKVDLALEKVSSERAKLGATHNRLEHSLQNVRIQHDNLANSESRIRDADMAKVISSYTADKIMMNSGVSVQVHSNTTPENILRLMGA